MVERGGLENRCARERTQGSNPCLSAIFPIERQPASLTAPMARAERAAASSTAGSELEVPPERSTIP